MAAGGAVVGGAVGADATGTAPAALALDSGSASGPAVTLRRGAAPPRPTITPRRGRPRRPSSFNAPRPSTAYEFPLRPGESCLGSRRSPSDPQPRRLSRLLRTGILFLKLLVLGGEAPSGMVAARFGTTLGAGLRRSVNRTLQSASFFEAPMPSLLHVRLPGCETCLTDAVYRPSRP